MIYIGIVVGVLQWAALLLMTLLCKPTCQMSYLISSNKARITTTTTIQNWNVWSQFKQGTRHEDPFGDI